MSTELHVAHLRARRGGKHAACVGTVHDRAQGRPSNVRTCCMREPVGECHSLAVIACSRNRLTRHVREEAGRHDGKTSFLSKGNNKLMIKQAQTQMDARMVETSQNTHQSQGNLLRQRRQLNQYDNDTEPVVSDK